jgi:hypothetical protein
MLPATYAIDEDEEDANEITRLSSPAEFTSFRTHSCSAASRTLTLDLWCGTT